MLAPRRPRRLTDEGVLLLVTDDLISPTIDSGYGVVDRPWRPTSILYPAFFGGPLAAAVLGLMNARRLALGRTVLLGVAAAGVGAVLARFVLTAALHEHGLAPILGGLTGVAVWSAVVATQRRPFQVHERRDGETASLVWPGIVAAVGGGLLEAVVLGLAVASL